jgi:hypothetical protein
MKSNALMEAMVEGTSSAARNVIKATMSRLVYDSNFLAYSETIRAFVEGYAVRALSRKATDQNYELEGGYGIIDKLGKETEDLEELINEPVALLGGAHDSSAGILGFVFTLLAQHDCVWKLLRQDILEAFGGENSQAISIDANQLMKATYLQCVIKEALRLYPIFPMSLRTAAQDCVLPVGGGLDGKKAFLVRKGQIVVFSSYVMHRRQDLWGAGASDFRP